MAIEKLQQKIGLVIRILFLDNLTNFKVCSVHFRSGRPSSDPSHEDFVPHLYLNNEPPPEVLDYLESLADAKPEKIPVPADYAKVPTSTVQSSAQQIKNAKAEAANRNPKPSILKRKRPKTEQTADQSAQQEQIEPQVVDEDEFQINNSVHIAEDQEFDQHEERPVKLTLVQSQIADAVGLKPGQTVIIRRRIIKK